MGNAWDAHKGSTPQNGRGVFITRQRLIMRLSVCGGSSKRGSPQTDNLYTILPQGPTSL